MAEFHPVWGYGRHYVRDDNYGLVGPFEDTRETKGVQCGQCGQKFDYGQAYGFVCGNLRCPVQLKAICTSSLNGWFDSAAAT